MYEINAKYKNSRLVDYNRWSEAPEVNKLVGALIAGMKAELGIKKIDGYKFNMKTLQMDLYHSYLTDKEQYIAFHRTKEHYHFKIKLNGKDVDNRYYPNPHITHTYFTGCIDYLASNGYIESSDGGQFKDEDNNCYGYLSRMRAADTLIALWVEYGLKAEMIIRFKPEEVIILKDKVEKVEYLYKGKAITKEIKRPIPDYMDTRAIIKMRNDVIAYNLLLDRTHIDLDAGCISEQDKDELLSRLLSTKYKYKYTINLGSKNVYRVFNNNNWKQGGRYYGAWWIGCSGILRKYIMINGEPTVELDYSGIHINLLYALKGVNFAELKTDAYELTGNDPDRELNKLILLTAYNCDGAKETAKAVFKNAIDEGNKKKFGLKKHQQVFDKLELLKKKHSLISEYIADHFGSTLQYHDSKVIERLINYFTNRRIPILTVHDSIVCQEKYSKLVYDQMLKYFIDYINEAFKCSIKYQSTYPLASDVFQRIKPDIDIEPWRLIQTINRYVSKALPRRGSMPKIHNIVIKVKEDKRSTSCNNRCKCTQRLNMYKAGRKVYMPKVLIQHSVEDGIAKLTIKE